MIDLDELIAELRGVVKESTQGTQVLGSPIVRGGILADEAASALESVRAERDAALARIAELEKSYRIIERLYKIERQERIEAEARIAEAAKLHRKRRAFADDWDTCTCGYDAFPCPDAIALGLNEGENEK